MIFYRVTTLICCEKEYTGGSKTRVVEQAAYENVVKAQGARLLHQRQEINQLKSKVNESKQRAAREQADLVAQVRAMEEEMARVQQEAMDLANREAQVQRDAQDLAEREARQRNYVANMEEQVDKGKAKATDPEPEEESDEYEDEEGDGDEDDEDDPMSSFVPHDDGTDDETMGHNVGTPRW